MDPGAPPGARRVTRATAWRDGSRLDGFHRRLRRSTSPVFDRASPVRAGAYRTGTRARGALRDPRIGERNRPAGRALAEVVSDPGLRTEICNSPGMTTDTATGADWAGTIADPPLSVTSSSQYYVKSRGPRAGVHRTRHAGSHNRAKRARLTGHRVPPGAGSDRSQPTRRQIDHTTHHPHSTGHPDHLRSSRSGEHRTYTMISK